MPLCPLCNLAMVFVEECDVSAWHCVQCRGTWMGGLALQRRAKLEATAGQPHLELPSLPELAETVSRSDSKEALTCSTCKKVMKKERFHPSIPVTIDRCESCGYLWLDAGEQGLVVALYRELAADSAGGAGLPGREANLARLQQAFPHGTSAASGGSGAAGNSAYRPTPAASYSSGNQNSRDGWDVAINVAGLVLNILFDLMLNSSSSSHRRRW